MEDGSFSTFDTVRCFFGCTAPDDGEDDECRCWWLSDVVAPSDDDWDKLVKGEKVETEGLLVVVFLL